MSILGLTVGAVWGLLHTVPDFRQGSSYRIFCVHAPSAVVALAGYYVMALAGAVYVIWKVKLADVAMMAAAPVGGALMLIALVTGSIWGTWLVRDACLTSMLTLLFLYLEDYMPPEVAEALERSAEARAAR